MDITYLLTVLGVILVSMMLHELMHGFVAYRLGDETAMLMGRLSFNPLKHIDPFMTILLPLLIVITNGLAGTATPVFGGAKPVPFNPANIKHDKWGIALMAIVGPLTNLVIALVSFALIVLMSVDTHGVLGTILTTTVMVNLGFFAFNILPIPPLDGSRVIYALAPDFIRSAMDVVERYGLLMVLAIVLLGNGILSIYMSAVIGWCLMLFSHLFGVPY